MTAWRARFQLKDLLSPEKDVTDVVGAIANETARRLRSSTVFPRSAASKLAAQFEGLEDVEGYDTVLEKLYDLADTERVWIY